jgi:hypothetical protein
VTEDENPHSELTGLQKAQNKARQDEVFGGLSLAEQAEYNSRAKRIHELDTQLRSSAGAKEGAANPSHQYATGELGSQSCTITLGLDKGAGFSQRVGS